MIRAFNSFSWILAGRIRVSFSSRVSQCAPVLWRVVWSAGQRLHPVIRPRAFLNFLLSFFHLLSLFLYFLVFCVLQGQRGTESYSITISCDLSMLSVVVICCYLLLWLKINFGDAILFVRPRGVYSVLSEHKTQDNKTSGKTNFCLKNGL